MDKLLSNMKLSTTEVKRESKSFEALQQGALVALLSSIGFSFEFKRPERIAAKTSQYITINEVYFNNKPLQFGKTIEGYCQKQFLSEYHSGMSVNELKTIKRRKDLNRSALSLKWLIQYVEQFGHSVKRRSIKSAKKTLQMEKVHEVYYDNTLLYTKESIIEIGRQIHCYIISQFDKKEKGLFFPAYNGYCIDILQQNIYNSSTTDQDNSGNATASIDLKTDEFIVDNDDTLEFLHTPTDHNASFVYNYY
ncbi:Uncharacterized protein QTN25_005484 [Entamoeba marina]